MEKVEKKQLIIFILVTYGVTFVQGLLMWFFYEKGANLSIFPETQMFYPAAGVMLAYLVTKKDTFSFRRGKKICLWIKGKQLEDVVSLYSAVLCIVYRANGGSECRWRTDRRVHSSMDRALYIDISDKSFS